jgi:large subunit ribosomal protein L4
MAETTTKATAKTALPKEVFAVEVPNHELLKLAYDSFLANNRLASATTKQRGEVRGGGKKPWAQKGTGRARFGSSRNPIWRGGGIVFGPRGNENYTKRVSTMSKRVAVKQALTLANEAGKIVIDEIKTTGKTKDVINYLAEHKLDRRILLVVDEKTPLLIRATANVQNILLIRSTYLSVYHILNADKIVIAPKSLETIKTWLVKEEA